MENRKHDQPIGSWLAIAKRVLLMVVMVLAANVVAMPTKAELVKAQPLVSELMSDDLTAFRAKRKAAEDVGDSASTFAKEAKSEAVKYLLLKGAFQYYVQGKSYEKAAQMVELLQSEIEGIKPKQVLELVQRITKYVSVEKAPRLYSIYRTVKVQEAALAMVERTEAALKRKPDDPILLRRLGEAQALAGDWMPAIETLAKLTSKVGTVAKAELLGNDLVETADFWWTYESYAGKDDADVFKLHAAMLYRMALAADKVDGLRKTIVEKRLNQVGNNCVAVSVPTVKKVYSGGVQLWANGPYWAKCNVGATKPEEYGYYFWWGDTVGYKRNASNNGWVSVKDGTSFSFTRDVCQTNDKRTHKLASDGYIDSTGNLVASHDAATVYLGAPWRMPTDAEVFALISCCDTVWINRNGVCGRLIKGRGAYSSKSIFIPAAGIGDGTRISKPNWLGYCWSSTPISGTSGSSWNLYFHSEPFTRGHDYRYLGMSIRPVR